MILSLLSSVAYVALHRPTNAGTVNVCSEISGESNTGRLSFVLPDQVWANWVVVVTGEPKPPSETIQICRL